MPSIKKHEIVKTEMKISSKPQNEFCSNGTEVNLKPLLPSGNTQFITNSTVTRKKFFRPVKVTAECLDKIPNVTKNKTTEVQSPIGSIELGNLSLYSIMRLIWES